MAADQGFSTSIAFSSGFLAKSRNIDLGGLTVDDIDLTNNDSTGGYQELQASDIKKHGQMTVQLLFQPGTAPPVGGSSQTITITFPIPPGGNTAATFSAQGYMKSLSAQIPYDKEMLATAVLQFTGVPTWTPGT